MSDHLRPLLIESPQNARVKAVVKLRTHKERRATGLMIAEGTREISRALAAGLFLDTLWYVQEGLQDKPALEALVAKCGLQAKQCILDSHLNQFYQYK